MKRYFKYTIMPAVMSLMATVNTGCLEEAFPQDATITGSQIAGGDKTALANAMPSYFNAGGDEAFDIGWVGFMIFYDAMTADYPTHDDSWDYFRYFNNQVSIGNIGVSQNFWVRNYYMAKRANSVISVCDTDPASDDAFNLGSAYVFRANTYMDLARLFEYRHTNVARMDEFADQNGIWGLTVPIITDKTTEAESRRMPRAPFYEMYRFINDDLVKAETYLKNFHSAPSKDMPCLGTAYGLHARLWLEMATRFDLHPNDLQAQLDAESAEELAVYQQLGVRTANDCYRKAAEYARKAINEGFTPLSQSQWLDTSTGFNTPNSSWMWGIFLSPNDASVKSNTWKTIPSFKSPEATYGMSSLTYGSYRMIDRRLFEKIDENDWRRLSWIDPAFTAIEDETEKEQAFNTTYSRYTKYDFATFSKFDAYAGFKFRPAGGDGATPSVGNAVCTPLMRVEEMYLIEAEALANCDGAAAGKAAIESFMNSYRMKEGTTFTCAANDKGGVIDVIWTQKRIELWGEGQVMWDYKRRELAIERGYPGTNHPSIYRYNSYPEAVAPWTCFYIPDRVKEQNSAVKLNPDPIKAITTLWTE